MAIQVQYLRNNLNTLIAKNQSGGFTNAQFNDWLKSAQVMLFNYYLEMKIRDAKEAVNALETFFKNQVITFTSGTAAKPTDIYLEDSWLYRWSKNTPTGIQVEMIPIIYKSMSEITELDRNPLAKASIVKKRLYWTYLNNRFKVYPSTVQTAELFYYREPAAAIYATTDVVTPNGTFQQYDPNTSVDLEWNVTEQENFIDLLTFFAGLPLRESAIIQFVQSKQKEALVN